MSSPKASRQSLPRWLDPKLILGLLLVLAAMAGGARVVAAADDTVQVWALKSDLPAQASLSKDDLVAKRVRFTDQSDASKYVKASSPVPEDARLARAVGAGELLPAHAVTTDEDKALVDMPIPVEAENAPSNLAVNDKVDLYVVPDNDDESSTQPAERTLENVTVTAIGQEGALGAGEGGRVTVRVAVSSEQKIASVAAAVSRGTPVLIRHSG